MASNEFGSHPTHCCARHGCKYGYDNCPVTNGKVEQVYACESCAPSEVVEARIARLKEELEWSKKMEAKGHNLTAGYYC